jgi:hypothetical protein
VSSLTGTLSISELTGGPDTYQVSAGDLAGPATKTAQVSCDLDPNTPTGVPLLLRFTSTDEATTARWSSQPTASTSGTIAVVTSGANNVATASLVLVDGSAGNRYTVECYLDYGATGVLESTDPLLDFVTIEVTS